MVKAAKVTLVGWEKIGAGYVTRDRARRRGGGEGRRPTPEPRPRAGSASSCRCTSSRVRTRTSRTRCRSGKATRREGVGRAPREDRGTVVATRKDPRLVSENG